MRILMDRVPYLRDTAISRTIMHEIHPMLQTPLFDCYPSAQVFHSISKCFCCSLIITCPLALPWREHQVIEIMDKRRPILVQHRPHRPNNTPESTILHRSSQMQCLVREAPVRQLCRVTSSKECKFRIGNSRSNDV